MAHFVETMFYVGAEPWHKLGTKLTAPPTSLEAIQMAGLDWRVEAHPIYANRMDVPLLRSVDRPYELTVNPYAFVGVPDGQVVRRMTDGRHLGVVGPRWTPVQNADAFNFFDPLVQDGLAVYHTAGSLHGGRTVWILAQIGETRNIIGDDGVGQFLLLSMGHDGKRAIQITPTPVRVVCANTLHAAELKASGGKTMIRIAHTANAVKRLGDLQDFIRPFLASFDQTMNSFQFLAQYALDSTKVLEYLDALFPLPADSNPVRMQKVRDMILQKFEGGLLGYDAIPASYRRTYWTLYNAVTEYVDHERGSDDNRVNSAWFGSGAKLKEKALELALMGATGG